MKWQTGSGWQTPRFSRRSKMPAPNMHNKLRDPRPRALSCHLLQLPGMCKRGDKRLRAGPSIAV